MGSLKKFWVAGLITALIFAVPLYEQIAFAYVIVFGPALTFAAIVEIEIRGEGYTKAKHWALILLSIGAYWLGAAIYGRSVAPRPWVAPCGKLLGSCPREQPKAYRTGTRNYFKRRDRFTSVALQT